MFNKNQCPACGFRQLNQVLKKDGNPKKLRLCLEEGTEEEQVITCTCFICSKCGNVWTYEDRD